MVWLAASLRYQAMFAGEEPTNATPAPAMVIFEVDPKTNTRSGCPASAQAASTGASSTCSSVRWCTAYALSQNSRKSGAAAGIAASRRTVSSL